MTLIQRRWIPIVLLAVVTGLCAPVFAQDEEPAKDDVAAWISRLGHPKYKVRERATSHLATLGRKALSGLRAATSDSNPEVRKRAAQIITRIGAALAEERATVGTPPIDIKIANLALSNAAKVLAERSGYTIRLDKAVRSDTQVTLALDGARFFPILVALCKAANVTFVIDDTGAVLLKPGPFVDRPRRFVGPYMFELLWVERVRRRSFDGKDNKPFARASVRLSWEPALRITGIGREGKLVRNVGKRQIVRELTQPIDAAATHVSLEPSIGLELAGSLRTVTTPIGHGGGFGTTDKKVSFSLRSMSTSSTSISVRFTMTGIDKAPSDRALMFEIEGSKKKRLPPKSRSIDGQLGRRSVNLRFSFDASFGPQKLVLTYPDEVRKKQIESAFEKIELPK